MADVAFKEAARFFAATRGHGATARDVSSFFKRKGLRVLFRAYWDRSSGSARRKFAADRIQFDRALEVAEY